MLRPILALLLVGPALASCDSSPQPQDSDGNRQPAPVDASGPSEAGDVPASQTADGGIDPPVLVPEAEKGEKGGRNILLSFARNIELAKYDAAWSLLGEEDRRKWPKSEFADIFADLDKVTVAVGNGEMEGAAGSAYYTAPLTVTGTDEAGRPIVIDGEAVLRRVNDVDGASADQLRWHFQSLTLDWTH